MCLLSINQFEWKGATRDIIYGYKMYSHRGLSFYQNTPLEYDKVYTAKSTTVVIDNVSAYGIQYMSGFHILLTLKDVLRYATGELLPWVVYQVEGYNPIVTGYDSGNAKVVVCEKMKLLRCVGRMSPCYTKPASINTFKFERL